MAASPTHSTSSHSDSDSASAAMAAAMGFSNFGKHPPSKKRKFNTATDAFIEGDELSNIDKGGKKGQGSGGNEVPLGKMRSLGAVRVGGGNEEEIELDDDDEDRDENGGARLGLGEVYGEDEGPRYIDTSLPPPTISGYTYPPNPVDIGYEAVNEEEDDEGPRYIDTSLPPPIEDISRNGAQYIETSLPIPAPEAEIETAAIPDDEAREMQIRIDAILASIQPPPGAESDDTVGTSFVSPIAHNPHHVAGLPPRPTGVGFGRGRGRGMSDAGSVASGSGRGRGERNAEWYKGYYDHSFNENPWEKLEVRLGLEAVGRWVKRPVGGANGRVGG